MQSAFLRGLTAGLFASFVLGSCVSETEDPTAAPNNPSKDVSPKADKKPAAKPDTPKTAMPDKAPAVFKVRFKTTVGDMVLECHRDWAPIGADRFFELVKAGFYEEIAFFRVMPRFIAQFGIHGDPDQAREWTGKQLADDPVKQSNARGTVTFATAGPNTRTTQMFINFKDNRGLDGQGFAPFAKVIEGMEAVDKIFQVGQRPSQARIKREGNAYLKKDYPQLTYIEGAEYVGESK